MATKVDLDSDQESKLMLRKDSERGGGGLSFWQSLCCRMLTYGSVPKHVAFIMDGNRRFAQKMQIGRSLGHALGFDKLAQVRTYTSCSFSSYMCVQV